MPGETVLVIGAGPIGILQAELARMQGAKVIIAEFRKNRLMMAKKFHYEFYIHTAKEDLVAETKKSRPAARRGTSPLSRAPVRGSRNALRGRLSLFGSLPAGKSPITIDSRTIHYKGNIRLRRGLVHGVPDP